MQIGPIETTTRQRRERWHRGFTRADRVSREALRKGRTQHTRAVQNGAVVVEIALKVPNVAVPVRRHLNHAAGKSA